MQSASPDFAQLKSNMKASWMAGDFGQIANFTIKAAEEFWKDADSDISILKQVKAEYAKLQ
jgi:hypothetical protein